MKTYDSNAANLELTQMASREKLYEEVWAEPMLKVATRHRAQLQTDPLPVFDIAHAPFHLALRPGAVGAASPGPHPPMAAEGFRLGIKDGGGSLPPED